ncbi:diguanylate phosphodiesterase [Arthrobacter sp. RIT-PI-e]|uniref:putative bifunctional diguanylate cyclase/phosphodiesterase n=1 Tax=Arthrobacter sp. RIT-PI-e TaxID=1681197 RepID=UPI0006766F4F|nr:bifunctional diguanylate cyclase/phosphodiesterase [Arthrobacter sp. RIT-PI-e]KNC18486.1 diguanylate phosphodiesterase [Arthrobacter sp. RIT-PI-e]
MSTGQRDPRLALLVDSIVRLSRGELSSRIEPSSARDEVDAVITGVNLLAEELEQVYEQFEKRVESRTAMLRQAHLDMMKMAMSDGLTGLANRVALMDAIEEALSLAENGDSPPALLLLDLDSFKNVNDRFGHDAGDRVLKEVASRLNQVVRDTDMVARLGGDEFAILLPAASLDIAMQVARRALEVLAERIELDNLNVHSRASIGVRVGTSGQNAEELLLDADTAMYAAKREGRSIIKVFEPVMLYSRQLRSQMATELRGAIASDELVLHYQPVVDLASHRILGVEVLVRWQHPVRGLIPPDTFIPLAEEIGVIHDLDRWVMTSSLRQLGQWRNDLHLDEDFQLRVNLSALELKQLDLVDFIRGLLREFDLPARCLVVEITETAIVTRGEVEMYSLLSLKQLGVGIEIDDFGTGYSSISYLRELPVSMVKVDRSLLAELDTRPGQHEFVAAILQLIRAAGLEAVFEGIETREQAQTLRDMGCSSGQGFYFSRPMPGDDMAALLTTTHHLRAEEHLEGARSTPSR